MPIAERTIERLRRTTTDGSGVPSPMEAMPELKFAELIDGVVYMPSPQTSDHGQRRDQNRHVAWNVHRKYAGLRCGQPVDVADASERTAA